MRRSAVKPYERTWSAVSDNFANCYEKRDSRKGFLAQ